MKLTERHLVNAIIGLCKPTRFWPRDLYDLGFRVHSIEQPFLNSKGKKVTPDVTLSNLNLNCALLFECKTGGYVKPGQIEHYPEVTDDDVRLNGLVPTSDPASFSSDITVLCTHEEFPRVRIDLEKAGWTLPVVALAPAQSIRLMMNRMSNSPTHSLFVSGIRLSPTDRIPVHYVPLMASHATDYDVASTVLPVLVARIRKGQRQFTVLDLAEQLFRHTWDLIDPSEQQELCVRVHSVLSLAAKTDFRGLLQRIGGTRKNPWWEISVPEEGGATQRYFRLVQSRAKHFLGRLLKGAAKVDRRYTQTTEEDVLAELERGADDEPDDSEK